MHVAMVSVSYFLYQPVTEQVEQARPVHELQYISKISIEQFIDKLYTGYLQGDHLGILDNSD